MVKFFRAKKSHSRALEKVKFAIFFNHGEGCKRPKEILEALEKVEFENFLQP